MYLEKKMSKTATGAEKIGDMGYIHRRIRGERERERERERHQLFTFLVIDLIR
jgi:hypothetical protein